MKSLTPTATSFSNSKTFLASLLTCIMLVAPLTPIGFASTNRLAPVQSKGAAKQTPAQKADPATNAAPRKQKEQPVAPAAVSITATKTDNRTPAQPVGPTDTINYTVTITNGGTTDALGVVFSDIIDPNTTLVPNSIQSTPLANPDVFNVIGNVRIQPNAGQGLLVNDFNPDNGNNSGITASGPTTSTGGGNVVVNSDGSFSYNPAPGFTGTDSFSYTVTNTTTSKTDTATVTLNVGNGTATPGGSVIWFIDNSNAAAGRDGRITNPFSSIAEFNSTAADEAGDIIFIYTGNGPSYVGPVVLLNNQQLIGQGVALTTATGFTVPPYSDPLPVAAAAPAINSAAAAGSNTVTLNSAAGGNTIRGVTLANATDSDIAGTNFGMLTVSATTLNGTGRALNLSTGTLAATFLSISSSSSPAQGISLSSIGGSLSTPGTTIFGNPTQCILVTGSTLNADFGNTSCTGGTDGISLQNNSAGTRTFGTLTRSGGSGVAFLHANGGGATTVTGSTLITNPAGIGIDIQNSNANISFAATSVDKGSSANTGVNLVNNASRTITFTALDINTNGGVGLNANNSGALNVTNALGSEITATNNAAMTVSGGTALGLNFTLLQSTNSTGKGVELSGATGGIAVGTTTITNSTGIGFHALNNTNAVAGTFSFGNANITLTGSTGARLETNAKAISFGDLDISPDGGQRGLHATEQTGTLTTTSGDIVTTTGTAVEITGAGTAPLNMALTRVSVNGAPSGIVLQNTSASPGGFTVNGDGTSARNGSGGVINNTTDDGIRLTGANSITLKSINLTSPGDTVQPNVADNEAPLGEHGIEANGGGNIIVSGVFIDSPSGSGMIALNLTGTSRLNLNSLVTNIDNPQTHGLFIKNNNVNMTLFEVNDTDFTNSDSGASTLNVKNEGTANMTVEVRNGCIFEALNSQAITMDGGASAGTTGTLTSLVSGNIFRNAVASVAGGTNITSENNVAALVVNGATHNATIENNTFDNIAEDGRIANTSVIRTQNSGGKLNAIVRNNTIQNINFQTGAGGRHVIGHVFEPVSYNASDFSNLRIEGNSATNVTFTATNREFIFIDYREFSSNGDIKILGNNWNMPTDAATSESVELRFRPANPSTIDVQMDNNGNGTGAIHSAATRFLNVDVEEAANANVTITNNKFTNLNVAPGASIDVQTEDNAAAGSGATACVNISGNNLLTAGNTIVLNEAAGTTMNVTQASTAAMSTANNAATVTVTVGSPTFGVPPCALPSNSTFEAFESGSQPEGARAAQAAQSSGVTSAPSVSLPQQVAAPVGDRMASFIMPQQALIEAAANSGNAARAAEDKEQAAKAAGKNDGTVQPSVANFPITIGTLGAGKSVTITFSVTVNNPLAASVTEIINQGTVSSTSASFPDVKTTDPDGSDAQGRTITAVIPQPTITINNASAPEPQSGSAPMPFSVVLSNAYTVPVTVNFQTADGTATQPTDYTATSGTLTFNAGQTFQTISVPVNSDGDNGESDENFTVTLSAPVSGTISGAGVGTGTITAANPPGTVLISEVRTSGPGGTNDDFVELYNNTDAPIDISNFALVKSGADCSITPIVVAVIPAATTLPARGHYLIAGSAYSLTATAAPDQTLLVTDDIEDDRNLALFDTASPVNFSTATRRDAVGFGTNTLGNCELLREGSTLPAAAGSTSEYSFARKLTTGLPQDTNDGAADFILVSTTPAVPVGSNATPILGAPGTENLASPIQRNAVIKASLIDPTLPSVAPPNRVRSSFGANPTNAAFGTLSIQRRFKNTLGVPVTRLRFRIVDLTTINNRTAGQSDLRVLSSTGVVTNSAGNTVVTVNGLTLEAPPQPNGGGLNSTLSVVLPGGGIAPGNSIDVQFLLGVQEQGAFSFFVNVEALPGLGAALAEEGTGAMKDGATTKQRRLKADAGGAAATTPEKQ